MSSLIVTDTAGKRAGLSNVLHRLGMRDFQIEATMGSVASNAASLSQLGITSTFRQTGYAIREDRRAVCARIREAAQSGTGKIFIATDDDQEGDVIARDVWQMVIAPEDRARVRRVKARSLLPTHVNDAFEMSSPIESITASKGDARRILDRIIDALCRSQGVLLGRVEGSLLLALAKQRPVVGVTAYTATSDDCGEPWIAHQPVYAGDEVTVPKMVAAGLSVGSRVVTTVGARPMNHDEILLSASVETKAKLKDVSKAMQKLYESGKISYPHSSKRALSTESMQRLEMIAKMNGAAFDLDLFRLAQGEIPNATEHEAVNPTAFDIPLNRDAGELSLPEKVLVHIARYLVDCGVRCTIEQPTLESLKKLPDALAGLRWHRKTDMGIRLYQGLKKQESAFEPWTQEQSLFHMINKNGLSQSDKAVEHVGRFLALDLVNAKFDLTEKGNEWCANLSQLFKYENLSQLVEEYLEINREAAAMMVADMVEKFGIPINSNDKIVFDQEH